MDQVLAKVMARRAIITFPQSRSAPSDVIGPDEIKILAAAAPVGARWP